MNRKIQELCIWCGPLAMVLFAIGMATAGYLQPPSPNDSAAEVAAMYENDRSRIRVGLVIVMLAGVTTAFFVAAITEQMRRVEGRRTPLANVQLGTGMIGILLFILPMMAVQTAAFRTGRDPETLQTLTDLGWITLVGVWAIASMQCMAIAFCAFRDQNGLVFPRWVGYFNIWVALIFVPDSALYFFKTGPFAWEGALVWWLPVIAFVSWFIVMFLVVRKAIRADEDGDAEPILTEPVSAQRIEVTH